MSMPIEGNQGRFFRPCTEKETAYSNDYYDEITAFILEIITQIPKDSNYDFIRAKVQERFPILKDRETYGRTLLAVVTSVRCQLKKL